MKKNVLVVAQDFPYPLDYAGPIDSFNKIRALHANGFNVYLISTIKAKVTDESVRVMNEFCVQIHVIQRQYGAKNLFSALPFQIKSRINNGEIYRICQQMENVRFDAVICDGYYPIEAVRKIAIELKIENIYLRVNNNEIKYFFSLAKASSNVLKKVYYISDAVKFYLHEKLVLPKIKLKGLLHVSYEEKEHYEIKFPKFKHYFLPAAVDVSEMNEYIKHDDKKVLFVGSLFMPNNVEGLIWYIRHIHDNLTNKYPNYKFIVSGNTRGINCSQLEKLFSNRKNIYFVNSPEDLTPLYRTSMIFINPMLNGAGVKLKTLNAICAGLPVVSTPVGNEGTGLVHGKHIMMAKDKNSFYEFIVMLMEDEKLRHDLVVNGQNYLAQTYNQRIALRRIFEDAQASVVSGALTADRLPSQF